MYVIGTDENGMGPRLGPLVATGATLRVARYRPAHLHGVGLALGIDDSKATAAFGKVAVAEGLVLALYEREVGAPCPDADALLERLCLDTPRELQRRCPEGTRLHCWQPLPVPCFGGEIAQGRDVLAGLERRGVHVERVRTTLACVASLNDSLRRGRSRMDVDLAQFERLVLDARRAVGEPLRAVCGMVGGIRKYPERFQHFRAEDVRVVQERRLRASYDVEGMGRVSFEVDADAHHLPVALASMVGKYVRELAVERQNRFFQGHDAALPSASGYHDPVTRRFVEASRDLRRKLAIADDCFERRTLRD